MIKKRILIIIDFILNLTIILIMTVGENIQISQDDFYSGLNGFESIKPFRSYVIVNLMLFTILIILCIIINVFSYYRIKRVFQTEYLLKYAKINIFISLIPFLLPIIILPIMFLIL